jgi:hypothetical protein
MYAVCLNPLPDGGAGKPSVNSANISHALDPKPERACHEQGEQRRNPLGGPNPFAVQYIGMTCGKK